MTNGHDPNTATLDEKIDQVMIPAISSTKQYRIWDERTGEVLHDLTLRPLSLKHAKILNARIKAAMESDRLANLGNTIAEVNENVDAPYEPMAAELLSFYGVQGASVEWINEHFASGQCREFIEAQLEVEKQHSFLRKNARALFKIFDIGQEAMETQAVQATRVVSSQISSPSSPLPASGQSTPTVSERNIPKDN